MWRHSIVDFNALPTSAPTPQPTRLVKLLALECIRKVGETHIPTIPEILVWDGDQPGNKCQSIAVAGYM
jgi:hypothetical protein